MPLTIFAKSSILDVRLVSEYVSAVNSRTFTIFYFQNKNSRPQMF